jgi:AICAR transformylase/IMP cyclohydrolase PurH
VGNAFCNILRGAYRSCPCIQGQEKHNNPCGVAENKDILKAYRDAWNCDRLSAFGGIVSVNRKIDLRLAKLIAKSGFLECVISPEFDPDALRLLQEKKESQASGITTDASGEPRIRL